jgi:hypothetical protein
MSTQHDHQGNFADGQATSEQHPETRPPGDFAAGQETSSSKHAHEGTFSDGQTRREHHPEREGHGTFAS